MISVRFCNRLRKQTCKEKEIQRKHYSSGFLFLCGRDGFQSRSLISRYISCYVSITSVIVLYVHQKKNKAPAKVHRIINTIIQNQTTNFKGGFPMITVIFVSVIAALGAAAIVGGLIAAVC